MGEGLLTIDVEHAVVGVMTSVMVDDTRGIGDSTSKAKEFTVEEHLCTWEG